MESQSSLEEIFKELDGLEDQIRDLFQSRTEAGGPIYGAHFLLWGAGNRSISQCRGFASMLRDQNFTCSSAILRMQLDTVLRLYGGFMYGNIAEYAEKILNGDVVSKLRASNGKKLQDRVLVEDLSKQQPWISSVYERSSGSIHLSRRHIMLAMTDVADDGTLSLQMGPSDKGVRPEYYVELGQAFIHTTKLAIEMIEMWYNNIGNTTGKWK